MLTLEQQHYRVVRLFEEIRDIWIARHVIDELLFDFEFLNELIFLSLV